MKRPTANQPIWFSRYESPLGVIFVAAAAEGVAELSIGADEASFLTRMRAKYGYQIIEMRRPFFGLFEKLDVYFNGLPVDFDLPVRLSGTAFEAAVWNALRTIPWGHTASYAEVASMIGRPKAARAVGNACGKNPLPIIIPCHRVLNADGRLGGYTGGVEIKIALLKIEGVL